MENDCSYCKYLPCEVLISSELLRHEIELTNKLNYKGVS